LNPRAIFASVFFHYQYVNGRWLSRVYSRQGELILTYGLCAASGHGGQSYLARSARVPKAIFPLASLIRVC